jgi:hypothetical protein
MANYIPMAVALVGWVVLWFYLFSLDSKVRKLKKDA